MPLPFRMSAFVPTNLVSLRNGFNCPRRKTMSLHFELISPPAAHSSSWVVCLCQIQACRQSSFGNG